MTQTEPPVLPTAPIGTTVRPSMTRSMRALLIGSLALNLLVLGLLAGAVIRGPDGFRRASGVDLALGPIVQALGPEDRDAIRADLRGRDALQQRGPRDRDRQVTALLTALRAPVYDPAAVEAALNGPRDRALAVQQVAQQALLARITAMTPAARQTFADRLADQMDHDRDDDRQGD